MSSDMEAILYDELWGLIPVLLPDLEMSEYGAMLERIKVATE